MGLALLVLINLVQAGTPTFLKFATPEIPAVTLVWLRHTIALLCLLPFGLRLHFLPLHGHEVLRIVVAAFLACTFTSLLQAEAMLRSTASAGAIMVAMEPIAMIVLALCFLHERFRPLLGVALGLALAGFVLLSQGALTLQLEGNLLYLLAVFCEASFPVLLMPIIQRHPPVHVAIYCLTAASFYLLPLQFGQDWAAILTVSPNAWVGVLYLGLGCSAFAFTLWLVTLRHLHLSTVAVSWFLQPVWGNGLAIWLLGEQLTLMTCLGGGLILSAVIVLCRHDHTSAPAPGKPATTAAYRAAA